jgi:hypothetical protein
VNRLYFPTIICAGFIWGAILTFTIWKQGFLNPKLELSIWKWIVLIILGVAVCFELVFYKP